MENTRFHKMLFIFFASAILFVRCAEQLHLRSSTELGNRNYVQKNNQFHLDASNRDNSIPFTKEFDGTKNTAIKATSNAGWSQSFGSLGDDFIQAILTGI